MSNSTALNDGRAASLPATRLSLWRVGLHLAVLCAALVLLPGCPESPPSKPPAKAEPESVSKYPEVSARYAEPGELPRDGSSLVIELEVPPIPAKLLAPAPPIPKEGAKR
jgi:hypothetical protein